MYPYSHPDFVATHSDARREALTPTHDPPGHDGAAQPERRRRVRGPLAAVLARMAGSLDRDRAARALFPGW